MTAPIPPNDPLPPTTPGAPGVPGSPPMGGPPGGLPPGGSPGDVPPGGPPPDKTNRTLIWVIGAIVIVLALTLGVLIGLLIKRDSGSDTATTGSTIPPATAGTSAPATTKKPTTTTESSTTTTTEKPTTTSTTTKPSTSSTAAGQPTCVFKPASLRLTYPTGWYTPTDPEFNCTLFDPQKFDVPKQSEAPLVAVRVSPADGDLATNVNETRTSPANTVQSEDQTTLGGHPADCFTLISTGQGLYDKGTRTYMCLVDFDGKVVRFENVRPPGAPDQGYDAVVRQMASDAVAV